MKFQYSLLSILFLSICVIGSTNDAEAARSRRGTTSRVDGQLCALKRGEWVAARRKNVNGVRKIIRKRNASEAHQTLCASLLQAGSVGSLSDLPSSADLVKQNSNVDSMGVQTVSGTPPAITEITSPKDTFWRAGVVDRIIAGSANHDDCNEFWGSSTDGQSGGMNACFMTQQVAYSFQNLTSAGNSLCYMKNSTAAENIESGGLTLVSGSLPDNDLSNLFSAPSGSSSRLVKVQVRGFEEVNSLNEEEGGASDIYIRVFSEGENRRAGNQAKYILNFCEGGNPSDENELITVRNDGKVTAKSKGGTFNAEVVGYLTPDDGGQLIFDSTKNRAVELIFSQGEGYFKSNLSISPDNLIKSKSAEVWGGETRYSYSVSSFSGSSVTDLALLAGAYKDVKPDREGQDFESSVEFRDSYYAAAPESSLADLLNEVEIEEDSFFSTDETPEPAEDFNCNKEADVVVNMDFSVGSMQDVQALCEAGRLEGGDLCFSNEDVALAAERFNSSCSPD